MILHAALVLSLTGIPSLRTYFLLIFIQYNFFRKNAKVQKRGKINLIGRLQLTTERMREEENEGIVQLRILRTQASNLPEEYKITPFLLLRYHRCALSTFGCWCTKWRLLNPVGTCFWFGLDPLWIQDFAHPPVHLQLSASCPDVPGYCSWRGQSRS